jgi:D-glycero-alpha-D-manno-heptose-7-phosphate kinase
MYAYLGELVTADVLAKQACRIEIDVLGKPIGVQDQYIVAYGGLRFLEFRQDGSIIPSKITLSEDLQRRLDESLMLFYTGVTRQSETILGEQQANIQNRLPILRELKDMTYAARDELQKGNLDAIGRLLDYSWKLKKQLASRISNSEIDELYQTARKAGAMGGKITGAGGGGFLLLYCPHDCKEAVRAALKDLRELPFHLERDGSKVIFNYRR